MRRTFIKGTGRYLPERLVTNDDLTQWMDTSDEWIEQRTGIKQRYWVPEEGGVGASDLGLEAAKIALDKAGWKPEDIDLIIFATLSPDIFFPGSGCLLQAKLGLETTPALDIRQQCTGFPVWAGNGRRLYPQQHGQSDSVRGRRSALHRSGYLHRRPGCHRYFRRRCCRGLL